MKIYLLVFCFFFSCREKEVIEIVPELVVDFEIQQEFYSIAIVNKIQNAVKYDLDYGDGTKVIGDTTIHAEFIGINNGRTLYDYKKDGIYTVVLTAYDKKGNSKTMEKQLIIDHIKKNTSIADFSLKLLDNGVVQMTNLSKNYLNFETLVSFGNWNYSTKKENPTFEFDMNGKYKISLSVQNIFADYKNSEIEIKNIIERELGYFKGIWYGNATNHIESFNESSITQYNNSGEFKPMILNTYTISNKQLTLINKEVDNNSLLTNEMKYEQIKTKFKVGKQDSKNWIIGFPIGYNGETIYEDDKNKSLEILEIREVSQRKIIPEMMDKAFWITYKIKADFGEKGKVDGELKVRYLIY